MARHGYLILALLFLAASPACAKKIKYKFAGKYSVESVLRKGKANRFIKEYLKYESEYFKIARKKGIAMDGWDLDPESLIPQEQREHTAASKEALDLMVLVKILNKNKLSYRLASKRGSRKQATQEAIEILKEKIKSYQQYNRDYPAFGGFITWIKVTNKVEPTYDWNDRVPALDNGELIWALYATYKSLEAIGETELAGSYKAYFQMLCDNALAIFYDPELGKIRAEVRIKDVNATTVSASNYANNIDGYYLDDVHEGLLFLYAISLFCDADQTNIDQLWQDVQFEKVETDYGTMYKAWPTAADPVGSPHIKWTRLMVPELDNAMALKISENQEIARSNLCTYGIPVSTNTPGQIGYTSYDPDIFAPYGAFSMIFQFAFQGKLTDGNYGLAWLLNMLKTDKMQGPVGNGESYSVEEGTNQLKDVSFLATADGKMLIWCAILGGITDEVRRGLKEDGLYERFMAIVEQEYAETFGSVDDIKSSGTYQLPEGPVEGTWEQRDPEDSNEEVVILGFGEDSGCWKYQQGQENWGEFTKPTFYDDHVLIKFIEQDANGGWGWAGASLTCELTPSENSYFKIRGTGSFLLKLEGDGSSDTVQVTLDGPTAWLSIPLKQAAGKAYSAVILDRMYDDVVIYDFLYCPGE